MITLYIGLGSNLSDPEQQIRNAVKQLTNIPNTALVQTSSLYSSRPMGPQDQPNYMNAVAELLSTLSALELLEQLQSIESQFGRVRQGNRWGARVLDLDILLYGDQRINSQRLTIPHYGMKEREFVLVPLAEITKNLILPCGENVTELVEQIPMNDLKIHSELS